MLILFYGNNYIINNNWSSDSLMVLIMLSLQEVLELIISSSYSQSRSCLSSICAASKHYGYSLYLARFHHLVHNLVGIPSLSSQILLIKVHFSLVLLVALCIFAFLYADTAALLLSTVHVVTGLY